MARQDDKKRDTTNRDSINKPEKYDVRNLEIKRNSIRGIAFTRANWSGQ